MDYLPELTNLFRFSLRVMICLKQIVVQMHSEYLKKPVLARQIERTEGNGFQLTSCQMQGWRRNMEDSHIYVQLQPEVHLFGVFDGHGGPEVAHYAAKFLPSEMLNQPYFVLKNYPRALVNVFKRIDHLIASKRGQQDLKQLNKKLPGTKKVGEDNIGFRAGTTAVVLLMTKDRLFVANIGDSRAVLCRSGKAIALSTDHKPDIPSEHNRIQKAGGQVNDGRINGSLNLSRAFGDLEYKQFQKGKYQQQCVISLPQITQTMRGEGDQFILMGCDGVWQKYVANSQKMVDKVSQLLQKNDSKDTLDKLFGQLVAKQPKQPNGFDNMTALLITFT